MTWVWPAAFIVVMAVAYAVLGIILWAVLKAVRSFGAIADQTAQVATALLGYDRLRAEVANLREQTQAAIAQELVPTRGAGVVHNQEAA